jgi:hypothetical protein
MALRYSPPARVELFTRGLQALGYQVRDGIGVGDLFVSWNRIGTADQVAHDCERQRVPVIVAENSSCGGMMPAHIHVTRTRHNTAGVYPVGGPERWDRLQVPLLPWRATGGETVVLAQRGIGSHPTAQPRGWQHLQAGRVRPHPGRHGAAIPLADDLARASRVITWGSAAAIQALAWGIPVQSGMPHWIGEQDNTDGGRLAMLRRMAWAQWSKEEICSGEAFRWLLQ